MNRIRQFAFFRFGGMAVPRLEEDGRVLNLFRNRAELKKAYGDLQAEIHQLKDRVKQQEGATARVQEMLERLETRLSEPQSGQQALVFYQLRDLWKTGSELIRSLTGELSAQQEDRERRLFLSDFNRRQFEQRQTVEHALNSAQIVAADVRGKLSELQKARARADRWWHYFRRRELERKLAAMQAESLGANQSLAEARQAFDSVANLEAPEFPGLSIDSRRAINLAAIAYAEVLALRLVRTPLLQMASEAMRRREPADTYGDVTTCTTLMSQIARAKLALAGRGSASPEVREASERLRVRAKFRAASEAVPTEESVSPPEPGPPPVLRDDYWDLRRLLLS